MKVLIEGDIKDVAALQIYEGNNEHQFLHLSDTIFIIKQMKVYLISSNHVNFKFN